MLYNDNDMGLLKDSQASEPPDTEPQVVDVPKPNDVEHVSEEEPKKKSDIQDKSVPVKRKKTKLSDAEFFAALG